MPLSILNVCPLCGNRHPVFVDMNALPGGARIEYECPVCKKTVVSEPSVYRTERTIPEGASQGQLVASD